MSTKSKFTIILVLTSLVGALVFGLLSYLDSRDSLRDAAFEELTAIRTARAQQIQEYFDSVFDEASVITENPSVERALIEFREAFRALDTDPVTADPAITEELAEYYERNILPGFRRLVERGEPDAQAFMPRSRTGRYLQHQYILPERYGEGERVVTTDGDTRYERVHATFHEDLRFIRDEFGYYDLFLIDADTGDIVYTVDKESDFATNIYEGPYRGSGLGDLVEKVKDDPTRRAVHFVDLQFYLPSLGEPALFVGSSIHDGDRVVGILAVQLTNTDLNNILTANGRWSEVGLKETGETYLVGSDGTLRNESRFFVEDKADYLAALEGTATPADDIARIDARGTSVLLQRVDTEATRAAFGGATDTRVIDDYRGVSVLSAFTPLELDDRDYALIAEIDAAEAFAPVRDLSVRMLVTTAIVLPLTALVGIWLASLLMRPSREMRDTATAFLEGDEDVAFQDQSSDEWGQLGQRLNGILAMTRERLGDARSAREETSDMIRRLMPYAIGERYSEGERDIVSSAEEASAACIMLVSDPRMTDLDNPARSRDLYEALDDRLDEIATREGVDILNQAGMHYLAFSGLTSDLANHPERLFRFVRAVGMALKAFNAEHETAIRAKAGFATSAMFGALVGNYSAAYEIWGDAVVRATDFAHAAKTGDLMMTAHSAELVGEADLGEVKRVRTLSGEHIEGVHLQGFLD